MPNVPAGGGSGGSSGSGISPDDQAKLDNCSVNVNADLATKVNLTRAISVSSPLVCSTPNLSADISITINAASNSSNGYMDSGTYNRIQSIQSYGTVHLVDLDGGNSAVTFTNIATNVFKSSAGVYKRVDLTGVNTVNFEFNLTNASTNNSTRIGLIYAQNTTAPFTWVFADNSSVPADNTAPPTENASWSMTALNTASSGYKIATNVPTIMQGPCTIGYVRWGGTGGSNDSPILNNPRVTLPGSTIPGVATFNGRFGTVLPVSGDYTANTIPDQSPAYRHDDKIIMNYGERQAILFAERRCKSPQNYIRKVTGLDVTRDFTLAASGNLSANSDPWAISGTDDRTKLQDLRDYLRTNYAGQEVELLIPRDRYIKISQTVNWDLQDIHTHWEGRGPYGSGFACSKSPGVSFQSGPLTFGGITNSTLAEQNVWRLAEGRSGANMLQGDDTFIASVTSDYDAVQVGDYLLFLSAWYYDNGGAIPWAPQCRWTARVRAKLGSGVIQLDRRFPFSFKSTTKSTLNGGAYVYKRSNGTAITGNVFARFSEMAADSNIVAADTSYDNKMFHSRVSMCNLGLTSASASTMQGGLPLDSLFDTVHIDGDSYGIYGNALQNCYMRNISVTNCGGFMELGVGSHLNVFENITWSHKETPRSADGSQGWILRIGEGSHDVVCRDVQLLGGTKTTSTSPGGGPGIIQAYNSTAFTIERCYAEVAFSSQTWEAFSSSIGDPQFGGGNHRLHDCYFNYLGAASGGLVHFHGNGCEAKRVKVTGAAASYSAPSITANASYCVFEDIYVKTTSNLVVSSGCNRTLVHRWENTGTSAVTNSGTNTVLMNNGTGKARLGSFVSAF